MVLAKLFAVIVLVSLTFGAGLQVDRDDLVALLKDASLLSRALIANLSLVPLLGAAIARLFALPPPVATGFLLMAIAPGVPFVVASVRKRGGRIALAVAMAFFLPLISLVTIPITASLVASAGAVPAPALEVRADVAALPDIAAYRRDHGGATDA